MSEQTYFQHLEGKFSLPSPVLYFKDSFTHFVKIVGGGITVKGVNAPYFKYIENKNKGSTQQKKKFGWNGMYRGGGNIREKKSISLSLTPPLSPLFYRLTHLL